MNPTDPREPPALHAHLLGPLRLRLGERPLTDDVWPRRGVRSLLLLLLATPGHRLPRDRILDDLWPGASPDTALNALYVALHSLRRVLEPDLRSGRTSSYVELAGGVLRLLPESVAWVDVAAFEANLARADAAGRRERLAAALALYAGDLLPEELYVDWPVARREHLRTAWRDAVLEYADLERESGRPLLAVPAIGRVLEQDPADEPAHRAMMRALAAVGRRDDALRHYARCRHALEHELGVQPGAETEALRSALEQFPTPAETDTPAVRPPGRRRFDNLPAAPNPLIGRTRELEALQDLLGDPGVRLVTVTGPGGIGKTRLALEAAAQVAGDVADGVCFAALAPIRDPDLFLPTLARTLGVEEATGRSAAESLQDVLREREVLLVLDNLEQLAPATAAVADLIAACPRLKILATSREPLHLRAEHVFPVPTLSVPPAGPNDDAGRLSLPSIRRYDAVALFAARARAVHPSFSLTGENASAVAAICHRLDGLPLAIELAAARSRHLSPAELRSRLGTRLLLLTGGPHDSPPRQRTMRDAIAWSYDLLTPEEQSLFRRLSVFAGGFDLGAAEAIGHGVEPSRHRDAASPPPDAATPGPLDLVASLVAKSLLQRDEAGSPRFAMLETIREFAVERLEASGESTTIRAAHAGYFLVLAETAAPLLHGAGDTGWLDRLDAEHDNLRAALAWACDGREGDTALRLSGALAEFWKTRGHLGEGRAWLDRALDLAGGGPSATRARARALQGAGNLALALGDNEQATARLTAASDDWRELGDRRGIGGALGALANLASAKGEYDEALALNQEALEHAEAIGDRLGVANTLNRLGIVAMDRGEHARATNLYERSLALYRALGHRSGEALVLNNLGATAFWRTDYRRAAELHGASLALWRALGNRPHAALVLANLGEDLRADGDLGRAMSVANEGLQLSRELGDKRSTATALFILGSLHQHEHHDPRAADPLVEGLLLYEALGDRLGMAWCLEALAGPAVAAGRPDLAARCCGAAEALREQVLVPRQPAEGPAFERHVGAARAALPTEAFDQAWAVGRSLPLADVVHEAATLPGARRPAATSP